MKNIVIFTLALVLSVSLFCVRSFADDYGGTADGAGIFVAENSTGEAVSSDDGFDDSEFEDEGDEE